jgi:hypothetical protein
MNEAAILQLQARRKEALRKFLQFMRENRNPDHRLPEDPESAFVEGLRIGYGNGLAEGFEIGLQVASESSGVYEAPDMGTA